MAPTPLFDRNCDLRAWLDGDYLYDTDLNWLAFVYDGHLWTSDENTIWLGPVKKNGIALDQDGRVVLWTSGEYVSGDAVVYRPGRPYRPPRPQRPARPHRPPRPERPPRPSGGWSPLSVEEWLTGGIVTAADPDESGGSISPDDEAGPRWVEFDS